MYPAVVSPFVFNTLLTRVFLVTKNERCLLKPFSQEICCGVSALSKIGMFT